ncbi:hypothetical protein CTI12_AA021870 [Artemisia annua]|uniref:LOB domain-containing protein n=1 Tax=Artemisia annua TaxID=35608 RepID=A0A2U1QIX4_ARTAN|nr:hypothetical protein CTI12_AA021870 [Artemisia annua]
MDRLPCVVCRNPEVNCMGYCVFRGVFGSGPLDREKSLSEAKEIFRCYQEDYVKYLMTSAGDKQRRIYLKNYLMQEIDSRVKNPEFGITLSQKKLDAVVKETERYNNVISLYQQTYPFFTDDVNIFGLGLTAPPFF